MDGFSCGKESSLMAYAHVSGAASVPGPAVRLAKMCSVPYHLKPPFQLAFRSLADGLAARIE